MRNRPYSLPAARIIHSGSAYTPPLSNWQRDRAAAPFERPRATAWSVIASLGWKDAVLGLGLALCFASLVILWSVVP